MNPSNQWLKIKWATISMLQIQASNNISVISASNNTVVALIPVQFGPYGVTAHPNGNTVYVTNSLSNNVSVIVQ